MTSIINVLGGTKIYYKIKNGRMIEIYTNASNVEETSVNNHITELKISDKTFRIGDEFPHDMDCISSSYEIVKIEQGAEEGKSYKNRYTFFTHIRNKVSTYILPCLMTTRYENRDYFMIDSYFINAYLTEDLQQIVLMYRFAKSDLYNKLEQNILKHTYYSGIDTSKLGFDCFIMDIPDEYLNDIELFVQGKYSKLSDKLKTNIKTFYNLNKRSRVFQVLDRDKELVKEMEKIYGCSFKGIDLEEKPNQVEEIWK